MLSGKVSCCINWAEKIVPTKAYAYLDKKKSLGHLDTNISKPNIMKFSLENITQFIE